MAESNRDEHISAEAFGASFSMRGRDILIIFVLLATVALLVFAVFDHTATTRTLMVEQAKLWREQTLEQTDFWREHVEDLTKRGHELYGLIWREMRLMTVLMSLPEAERRAVIPPQLEENIKKHLEASPQLNPPVFAPPQEEEQPADPGGLSPEKDPR
jgi:hypothetical protein